MPHAQAPDRNDRLFFYLVLIIVSAVRIPFLTAGYGNDPDAWAVADAARHLAAMGEYAASRLPGYPLPELACSVISRGGPLALNGCTALLSVAAVTCFVKLLKRVGSANHLLAGLAFGLTPVIFIYSTTSLDYVWAVAFILAAALAVLDDRPILAGLLLGAAIGCRLTSGAMLLPLGLLFSAGRSRVEAAKRVIAFWALAIAVGAVCFLPVVHRYGFGFLTFNEPSAFPTAITLFSRALLRVWGPLGLLGIGAALLVTVVQLLRRTRAAPTSAPSAAVRVVPIAAAITVVLYAVAFLRLPLEEGYLVPAVPFVILLLERILARNAFRLACAALCLSPFVGGLGRTAVTPSETLSDRTWTFRVGEQELFFDPLRGPIVRDYAERLHGMAFVDRVLAAGRTLPSGSIVVVGYWLPEIRVKLGSPVGGDVVPDEKADNHVRYAYLLDRGDMLHYAHDNVPLYFLPEMAEFNRDRHGVELQRCGALPLNEYWRR